MSGGVYYILNRGNNKIYVGQTGAIASRFAEHVYHLNTHRHVNKRLQHDWDVFGAQAFEFGVLTNAPRDFRFDETRRTTRGRLEAIFIRAYQSDNPNFGYNISHRK